MVADEADSRRSCAMAGGLGGYVLLLRVRAAAVQYFSVRPRRLAPGFDAWRTFAGGCCDRNRARKRRGGISVRRKNRIRAYTARRHGHDDSGTLPGDSGTFFCGRVRAARRAWLRRRILYCADQRVDPAHSPGGPQGRSAGRGKLALVCGRRRGVGRVLRGLALGTAEPWSDFSVVGGGHVRRDGLRAVFVAGFTIASAAVDRHAHAVPTGHSGTRARAGSRRGAPRAESYVHA